MHQETITPSPNPALHKASDGYVYWKGRCIEHYSFADLQEEQAALTRLALRCQYLEAKGFPVTGRTVLLQSCVEAPVSTPWLDALCSYYAFFQRGSEVAIIFYPRTQDSGSTELSRVAISITKSVEDEPRVLRHQSGYEAFHFFQDSGYASQRLVTYHEVSAYFERLGLAPAALNALLRTSPITQH